MLTASPVLIDATFNVITAHIIGAAIEVHRTLGPGLLESTYMPCLQFELTARQRRFVTQRAVPVHQAQVLTYMGLTGCHAGLLINFNVAKRDHRRRISVSPWLRVNPFPPQLCDWLFSATPW